jgi:hypothetical protein
MNFKEITTRQQLSTRGGGVEIDLTTLGFKGHKMSAYQNYLGGGMLGAIQVNDTIRSQASNIPLQLEFSNRFKELDEIGEKLMRYFHGLTNHEDDEWESATFEENQTRPNSAY